MCSILKLSATVWTLCATKNFALECLPFAFHQKKPHLTNTMELNRILISEYKLTSFFTAFCSIS